MLKLIFFLLLAANGLLFALAQGYLGNVSGSEHQPGRLASQLHSDQLRQISAASALAAAVPVKTDTTPLPTPTPAAAPTPVIFACTEVGNFSLADGRRFESQVQTLALGDRQSRRNVESDEISSYIVYIPAPGSKDGTDKKTRELAELGVSSFFVLPESSPLKGGISLGVFKLQTGAQNLLAALIKKGVHSARVAPRYGAAKQLAFRFRDIDRASKARLLQIAGAFPQQEIRSCK